MCGWRGRRWADDGVCPIADFRVRLTIVELKLRCKVLEAREGDKRKGYCLEQPSCQTYSLAATDHQPYQRLDARHVVRRADVVVRCLRRRQRPIRKRAAARPQLVQQSQE